MDSLFNPGSIKKSFKKTVIYPFDRTIFKAVDFLTNTVTYTVNPTGVIIPPSILNTFQPDGVDLTLNIQADENFNDCDKGFPVNNEDLPVNNKGSPVNNEGSLSNSNSLSHSSINHANPV